MVNRLVPVEKCLDRGCGIGWRDRRAPPLAVIMGKNSVNAAFETTLTEGLAAERRNFHVLFATLDQKEGMQAFSEKRKPAWKGK
jgi:enoyl-CoA hydratase